MAMIDCSLKKESKSPPCLSLDPPGSLYTRVTPAVLMFQLCGKIV